MYYLCMLELTINLIDALKTIVVLAIFLLTSSKDTFIEVKLFRATFHAVHIFLLINPCYPLICLYRAIYTGNR